MPDASTDALPGGVQGDRSTRTPSAFAARLASRPRIVVKVGTNVIVRDDGRLALGRLYSLAESIAHLRCNGRDVLLVSSGAIGLGMERLGLGSRPVDLPTLQACAAIGQSRLMAIYDDAFEKQGCRIAQILLTEEDFRDAQRLANLRATLASLLGFGVIPIVNENDTVSTTELDRPADSPGRERVFGDNDQLSALVLTHTDAGLLVLLSDVDGLFDGDPRGDGARRIGDVHEIDDEIQAFVQGKSRQGRGGMLTKLAAVRMATSAGRLAVIANGHAPGVLERICAGEDVGTRFWPGDTP